MIQKFQPHIINRRMDYWKDNGRKQCKRRHYLLQVYGFLIEQPLFVNWPFKIKIHKKKADSNGCYLAQCIKFMKDKRGNFQTLGVFLKTPIMLYGTYKFMWF